MDIKKQIVALGELSGWVHAGSYFASQHRAEDFWTCPIGFLGATETSSYLGLPDFCHCLNAMHEVEKFLTYAQRFEYVRMLGKMLECEVFDLEYHTTFASAEQRAEAILKTLDRWEDE